MLQIADGVSVEQHIVGVLVLGVVEHSGGVIDDLLHHVMVAELIGVSGTAGVGVEDADVSVGGNGEFDGVPFLSEHI